MAKKNEGRDAAKHAPSAPRRRDQSETEGRIGEGRHSGVRNVEAGGTQRSEANDRKRGSGGLDPDVRVGAKGVMQQDIGESICLQDGNDCRV